MAHSWSVTIKDYCDSIPLWGKIAIGTVAVVGIAKHLLGNKKRDSPLKKDYKTGVVYVYQFPRCKVIPSLSPFALKLETWLRMVDIPYENVECPVWTRSKEGTIPFVELNGIEYDDSSFIIRDLTKIFQKESLDGWLSPEDKAISRAFELMIENSTFWSYAYFRYTEYLERLLSNEILFPIPFLWRLMMPMWRMKAEFKKRMVTMGIGRHPREEIAGIGLEDLKSLSNFLGSKQFFHGDKPTKTDAYLFSVLAQIIYIPFDTEHQKFVHRECGNLIDYCERLKLKYWPDWNEICLTRSMNTWKKTI